MDEDVKASIGRPELDFIAFKNKPLSVAFENLSATVPAFMVLLRSKV